MQPFTLHPQLAQDTLFIKDLLLCRVVLMNDARFPWVILVPRRQGVCELMDLMPGEQTLVLNEIHKVSVFLKQFFKSEKLNVAALGNIVPQLHIHVIARFTQDAAWPKPVWGVGEAVKYTDAESKRLITALMQAVH
jgi:diadenosine tetraphosphate (Ap4A) HIT family hydrolase